MKKVIIKKLSLENFKGQTRDFLPNEDVTKVFAKNATGKTKLYEAFAWLLTGYTDATNGKNYELYDSTKELTPETPKARVRAEIMLDGVEYSVERSAQAKFVRKRNSLEYVKDTSDVYEMKLDDIVTSSTDFNTWVEHNLGNTTLIPFMLLGERFANLTLSDRKKAREILEQVSGEVTMEEMQGDYTMIANDLKKYSVEQLKERCKNKLKPLKLRHDELGTIIDTKMQLSATYDAAKVDALNKEIEDVKEAISAVDDMLLDSSKALEPIIKARNEQKMKIDSLCSELSVRRHAHNDKNRELLEVVAKKIRNIDAENATIVAENKRKAHDWAYTEQQYHSEKDTLAMLRSQRERLIARRDEIMAREFTDTTCATCGQKLPEELLEETRARFTKTKNEDLEIVVKQGKDVKGKIELCEKRIAELEEILAKGTEETPLKSKDALQEEYVELENKLVQFEATEEYKSLSKEIEELRANMPTLNVDQSGFAEQKEKLNATLEGLYAMLGEYNVLGRIVEEVESLKSEKRDTEIEIVCIEGQLDNIKMYEEEKARIVSDRINKLLDDCSIVMYSRQKDGELRPDCVILDKKGVPYATTNNANRLNSALSLQRMFCANANILLPVFVDEASIYDDEHLPKYSDTQCIYLYASNDNEMRTE